MRSNVIDNTEWIMHRAPGNGHAQDCCLLGKSWHSHLGSTSSICHGAVASAAATFSPSNAKGILHPIECSHHELLHPLDAKAETLEALSQLCSHSTANLSL
ncbi:mCG147514, partial [Mus musculus]